MESFEIAETEAIAAPSQCSEAELRFRIMIDTIPTFAWSCFRDGSVEFLNKRWLDFTGLSEEEAIGWGWTRAIHPDDAEELTEVWREILVSQEAGEAEVRLRGSDGSYRWFLFRVEPFRDQDGNIVRWFGTNTDIEALKRAENELRDVIDYAPQQVAIMAPDGRRLYANRLLLEYAGLTLEEFQSPGYMRKVFHPEDLEIMTSCGPILEGQSREVETRVRSKDGAYRWFLIRLFPFRDTSGRIVRWYAAGTDIEERKRAEERVRNENLALREEIDSVSMFEEIVGSSGGLQAVLSRVAKVAPTQATVLITGETGTGKELIARAIHKRSSRSSGPFVAVNCAAVPQSLIASELFGHEKGAFTGALQRHLGRFEAAAGGTIFLDEVGELPIETQVALLRVLQEREFERVGGDRVIQTDVRVIAATNRDLKAAVADGTFRSDLFYRLNVFPIHLPSLRERREDIPLLAEYFIARYAALAGKTIKKISKSTIELLQSYDWPGNVRELQNIIERSVILCETDSFSVDKSWLAPTQIQFVPSTMPLAQSVASQEKTTIEAMLAETRGRISGPSGAAVRLGMKASTLEYKIKSLNINKHAFKGDLAQ